MKNILSKKYIPAYVLLVIFLLIPAVTTGNYIISNLVNCMFFAAMAGILSVDMADRFPGVMLHLWQ